MKDRCALIAAAAVFSILAWVFWHYLGDDAFDVLMFIFLIVLAVDNYQLRKKIKSKNSDSSNQFDR
ncbi:MAG: hypothetical protein GY737_25665 [Desulfobacteraceae bacterium]|nr:hypothetical protein [Desulfobacteraceae bacterium]